MNTDASTEGRGRIAAWIVAALTLASLALKLHGAFDHPLWGDEIFQRTGALTSRWWQFLTWTHACSYYNMPPLSFAVHRAVMALFHTDRELAWRLPGVLAAAACVPLTYALARRMLNRPAALFTAGWCAFDLDLGWHAQIARAYPFLVFFLLAGLALATGAASRGRLIAGILCLTAACWSHLYAFIFLSGAVTVLWSIAWLQPAQAASVRQLRVSVTVALAANAPFFLGYQILGHLHPQTGSMPVAPDWPSAFAVVRWCVGRLTWINGPLANPLVFAAALGASLWLAARQRQLLAGALLGAGLLVLASLFYLARRHDFVEPRYLLGTAVMLWFGYGALFHLAWPTRARGLALAALGLLPLQAWRAWHNEQYFGTIANDRAAARALAAAVGYAHEKFPGAPVRLLPDSASLRGTAERLGVRAAAGATAPVAGTVWLLAGESSATRRYGDPVGRFVDDQARARNMSDAERLELRAACTQALWTVWQRSGRGLEVRHF